MFRQCSWSIIGIKLKIFLATRLSVEANPIASSAGFASTSLSLQSSSSHSYSLSTFLFTQPLHDTIRHLFGHVLSYAHNLILKASNIPTPLSYSFRIKRYHIQPSLFFTMFVRTFMPLPPPSPLSRYYSYYSFYH